MGEILRTFITNMGTPDERVARSTGMADIAALRSVMDERNQKIARDLLIPSACNENCKACFFVEPGTDNVKLTPDAVDELRLMASALGRDYPSVFTLYPREITTAREMLPVFSDYCQKRTLTNGKLLGKPGMMDTLWNAGIRSLSVTVPGNRTSFAWYTGEPAEEYGKLIQTIQSAVNRGFTVDTFMPVFRDNVDDVGEMSERLSKAGVGSIMCIRVIPVGRATNWDNGLFLDEDSALRFFRNVDEARGRIGNSTRIAMFGGSFGPNFYGREIFRYLAGQSGKWPDSKYLCPVVTGQFVGVSFASKKAYPCFELMSFPELQIGRWTGSGLEITNPLPSERTFRDNLKDSCSQSECEWQSLCLGGCRSAAFSFAKLRGEPNPLFAGQTVCQTRILEQIAGSGKKSQPAVKAANRITVKNTDTGNSCTACPMQSGCKGICAGTGK